MKNWIYVIFALLGFTACKDKSNKVDKAGIVQTESTQEKQAEHSVKLSIRFAKPITSKQVNILFSDQKLTQHSTYALSNLSKFEENINFDKSGIYHFQISPNESVPIVISNKENLIELDVNNTVTPPLYTVNSSKENAFFKSYLERFSPSAQPELEAKLSFLDSISPSCAAAEIYAFEITQFKGDYVTKLDAIKEKYKGKDYAINLLQLIAQLEKEPVTVGKKAPEFLLKGLDGKEYGPQSFKGKYVLLDFWASWCGPCRAEVPNVRKAYAKYKDKGFEVLGVSTDQSESKWKDAVSKLDMSWVSVRDDRGEVSSTYKIQYIPTVYLIGPDGVVLAENVRGPKLEQLLAKYLGK